MKTLIDFIKNLKSFYQFYKDYEYNGDACRVIIESYQEVLCSRTKTMSKPVYCANSVIAEMDRWYEDNKPIETSEFSTAFGVDVSQNAVEQYAETHFGRKPQNYLEFCSARDAKIIEESKEL